MLALNEQKAGPFPLHRSESTDPRLRCQIDQRFAQRFSRRHTLQKWQAELVLITLGEEGMMLFQRGQKPHHVPTKARQVFDVSGAGDTAIALFTLALCSGATALEAADIANNASAVVVGKLGTATVSPEELRKNFENG